MRTKTGEVPPGVSPVHGLQVSEPAPAQTTNPRRSRAGPARSSDPSLTLPESGDKGSVGGALRGWFVFNGGDGGRKPGRLQAGASGGGFLLPEALGGGEEGSGASGPGTELPGQNGPGRWRATGCRGRASPSRVPARAAAE